MAIEKKEEAHLTDEPVATSVITVPNRSPLWGSSSYRGNCDGTLIRGLILRYKPRRVADPMMGSGTTKDVVESLNDSGERPIGFWGGDLHSGFNLRETTPPGPFDFVFLHPPYWNMIRYSDDPRDLSTIDDYDDFRDALEACLIRCYDCLAPKGRLAVLIGDLRRRGTYTPIVRDVLNLEGEIGQLRSLIVKTQHNCTSDKKLYAPMEDVRIAHEYCVIFKKV